MKLTMNYSRAKIVSFDPTTYAVPKARLGALVLAAQELAKRCGADGTSGERTAAQRLQRAADEAVAAMDLSGDAQQSRLPSPALRREVVRLVSAVLGQLRAHRRADLREHARDLARVMRMFARVERPSRASNKTLLLGLANVRRQVERQPELVAPFLPTRMLDSLWQAHAALEAAVIRPPPAVVTVSLHHHVHVVSSRIAEYVFNVLATTDFTAPMTEARAKKRLQPLTTLRATTRKRRQRRKRRATKAKSRATVVAAPIESTAVVAPARRRSTKKRG